MNKYILINGKILTPFEQLNDYVLEITGNKISNIFKSDMLDNKSYKKDYDSIFDLKGKIISPGFIDIHNHGAKEIDFLYLEKDSIDDATMHYATGGTTSFLLTPAALPFKDAINNLKRVKKVISKEYRGARVLGINMEGPYLSPKHGAQNPEYFKDPIKEEYEAIIQEALPFLKVMTVPPEIQGAKGLIKYLNQNGVIISIGHTEASRDEVDFAVLNGAKLITHIFNAMGQPSQIDGGVKPVGVEEYLMINDKLMAEVMADRYGAHIDPIFLKILLRVKGKDKIILITDSVFPAGLKSGTYSFSDGRKFIVFEGDVNRLEANNGLAGSVMNMNNAVKNMINHTGIGIKDAVLMASYNPAKLLRIDNKKGNIQVGMDADIAIIDENINVYMTIVEGDIVFDDLENNNDKT